MYWPDTNTGVDVEPTRKPVASAVRKFFTEGGAGQAPTVPGGDWFNQVTNELLNVVSAAGIEPNKTADDQLLQAIQYLNKARTFISVPAMIASLSDSANIMLGDELSTGKTRWRVSSNVAGIDIGNGFYAEPLTSICFDDWGFTSAVSLAADLNAILTMAGVFGIGRVYSNGGKTYYTEDTINLSGLNIDLDFGWSVLIDNVQGFRADLSGRAKPTFIQYDSTGSKVRCVNHIVHPSRSQSASGNGADIHYWIGGQQMGTAFTIGPLVEDIVLQDTKRGCMPVAVLGNVKNWNVRRFDVYGDASWGIDIEWGWQGTEGSKTGIPEDPAVNQTMENGQIPYNGHVENFNGYELQNCKGFLRTAGCYNTKFENCVGYNVDNFIYVYGGDRNPSVFTQNDRFKGCKLKINRSTFTKPTYCITVLFPNKDGTLGDPLPSWTDYDHTVVFDDCEIQGNYASGAFQTAGLRFYGCNGAAEFNRCTFKYCYYGARLEKAASNPDYTSRFSLGFNYCIFKRNYQDASLNSIDGVNFNHCKFRSMLGTALPSVGVGLGAASNYNKFIDCSWSGQNDRSGGVKAFIQLGSGAGNHLVRCRFEPFLSAYKPVEQTGSGVFNGYGNSSTGELTLSTNAAKKIVGESSTITKGTSGLSGPQLDFNIGEVWLTNSAMTINQCVNGKSGDRLVIRGGTNDSFTIQHNAVPVGSGRFLNLTKTNYSHTSDDWAHTYVNSGGDWYEI